ncbi:MAG: 16S rRNA processing protein RimM [Anaerolineales bacterium]|nr:16S rRNA processing protein RimM [Anaerolineales bacterium]
MTSRRRQFAEDRRNKEKSGLPVQGEPSFLVIGRLQRPHGITGEIIMGLLTDFPERIKKGKKVFLGEDHLEVKINSVKDHPKGVMITFAGFTSREDIAEYTNSYVYVSLDDIPSLPDGEYYHHQLLGMSVHSQEGEVLGVVSEILETGANDVFLVLDPEGKEILVPNIDHVVLKVDVNKKIIEINRLKGI